MTIKLPEPKRVLNNVNTIKDLDGRYEYVQNYVDAVPEDDDNSIKSWDKWLDNPEIPWNNREVQYYTHGLDELYSEMLHALVNGTTGGGKTTLLISILREYLDKGAYVLYRDDGKKEFRYLAYHFPHETRIWIPDEEQCSIQLYGMPEEVEISRFNSPQDIIDAVYTFDKQLNIIVYEPYSRPGPEGWKMKSDFYSMLFESLLLKVQGLRDSKKLHLIFNIDELNDLIPPMGKGTTGSSVRAAMEVDIRKLRGHNVQLFGSTHRFNQIGIDTRSQMKNIFLKQAYGYDSYSFLSHNLISSSPKTFWGLIKKVSQMPANTYLLFDKNRNFDLCTFPDIPRPPGLDCECIGTLKETPPKKVYDDRVQIAAYRVMGKSPAEIRDATGLTIGSVNNALVYFKESKLFSPDFFPPYK